MEKLLLYMCCAPCGAYPLDKLFNLYELSILFYGPNIHPESEYEKRSDAVKLLADSRGVDLEREPYDAEQWHSLVRGLENEPEGGKRCAVCFRMRLEKTAERAQKGGFAFFSETLTVSPHKPEKLIYEIGQSVGQKYGVKFIPGDFRKRGGFNKSCRISRELGLYRQNYCGCLYSRRKDDNTQIKKGRGI